eukprot:4726946-Prymnesium_polylepis.1
MYMRLDAAVARQLTPQQTQRSADHRRLCSRRHATGTLLGSMHTTIGALRLVAHLQNGTQNHRSPILTGRFRRD